MADKLNSGAGFIRVLRFPLPIIIPPISPQSPSPIIRGWYNRPVVAAVPKVPPYKLKKRAFNYIKIHIFLQLPSHSLSLFYKNFFLNII
jgi:hypothetical protein